MKAALKSPVGLTPTGAGPKIVSYSLPFVVAGIIAGTWFPAFSHISNNVLPSMKITGWIFIAIGIIIYLASLTIFLKEFPKGKLIKTGVYSLSRNPLYASWAVFIFPGIALVCNNWFFILAAVAMNISLQLLIKIEEEQLLNIFGEEYKTYCKKTGRIGFLPRF